MNILDLHQARSDAIETQVKSLHQSIQKQSHRLARQHEKNQACKLLQEQEQEQQGQSQNESNGGTRSNGETKGVKSNWTDIYDKWNNWHDTEDIETDITKTKKKLSRLEKNNEMQKRKNAHNNNSGGSSPFCCSSSQNRSAEREVVKMSTKERLNHMRLFRMDHGNVEFEQGNYSKACKWYDKSLIYYEYCFMACGTEKEQVEEERLLCLLNTAACHLGLKKYKDCIDVCTEALEASKSNTKHGSKLVKALFRRAKAYRLSQDFQKAGDDLRNAQDILLLTTKNDNDNDNDVRSRSETLDKELELLTLAIDKYKSNSVAFAKRMMRKR